MIAQAGSDIRKRIEDDLIRPGIVHEQAGAIAGLDSCLADQFRREVIIVMIQISKSHTNTLLFETESRTDKIPIHTAQHSDQRKKH